MALSLKKPEEGWKLHFYSVSEVGRSTAKERFLYTLKRMRYGSSGRGQKGPEGGGGGRVTFPFAFGGRCRAGGLEEGDWGGMVWGNQSPRVQFPVASHHHHHFSLVFKSWTSLTVLFLSSHLGTIWNYTFRTFEA